MTKRINTQAPNIVHAHDEQIWTNINQLKFKLLQSTLQKQAIEDAIKKQLELGMSVSYKTIKYMNRDLHNVKADIKTMKKLIRKENLRHEQAIRKISK